jgi:Protein of unknown function (DUF3592)
LILSDTDSVSFNFSGAGTTKSRASVGSCLKFDLVNEIRLCRVLICGTTHRTKRIALGITLTVEMESASMGIRRYLPLFLALPLLTLSIGDIVVKRQAVARFVRDEGTVVSVVRASCGRSTQCGYPVIEYQVGSGRTNRIRSDVASYPAPAIGSRIPLLVDPRNRYDARVAGLRGYWARSIVTSSLALAFIAVAVLAVVFPGINMQPAFRRKSHQDGARPVGLFGDLTGSRGGVPGVAPIGATELREALLALNRDDLPWSIRASQQSDIDLSAALKFEDPLWGQRIQDARVNRGIRVLLRLHPDSHVVRSIDERFTVEWRNGIAAVATKASLARGELTLERGQLTQQVNEVTFGRRADGSFGRSGDFQFHSDTMKEALRQLVTQHGWEWRGVVVGGL